ncbi:hypothetical protein MKZ38_001632 [Zalerion maritima]|uniref:Metallo-beta-lactamase domain-containing protein n=1 Tax=Zalerion maritima TaxID=339359 RepID=A0AAD5WSZ9_9PEZI|nr:hypothetical protein MKZ38_001632 [Zalerion maritima]
MSEIAATTADLLALESAASGQVAISALRGGTFTLPKKLFVSGSADDERTLVPSLSFLLLCESREGKRRRIIFDLGLRRDVDAYTPQLQAHVRNRQPMRTFPDVRQGLLDGNLDPGAIDEVILSHVHWDHIGTPSDFPCARFFVGAGSLALLTAGMSGHMSHSNFQHDLFDNMDVREFTDPGTPGDDEESGSETGWRSAGGLRILDISSDGAVYAVDSPGHLTGHVALLARRGPRRWVLLIGDACHDGRLLTGEREIAQWTDDEGRACCIHADKETATATLASFARWKQASEQCGIDLQIIFAHDAEWAQSHAEAFFPGTI